MKTDRINLSLLSILLYFTINSCNDNYSTNYFNETTGFYNLKGKVKRIKSNVYKAEIIGNKIRKGEKIDSRIFGRNRELFFNKFGQLINRKQFSKDDLLINETTFEYNSNGSIKKYKMNEIEVTFKYNEFDSIEKVTTKSDKFTQILKAEYDQMKRRVRKFELINESTKSTTINKYNEFNKIIEKSKYDKEKELIEQWKYIYDREKLIKETYANRDSLITGIGKIIINYKYKNDILSEKRTNYNNNSFVSISYEYYDNGVLKKESELEINQNGKESNVKENEYDSIGNIIVSDIFNTIKYEYDNNNNWIKRIVFQNNYPNYIVYREIEYYQ